MSKLFRSRATVTGAPLTKAQIEVLKMCFERSRSSTTKTHGSWISGRIAKTLTYYRDPPLLRWAHGLYEITDAGRAALAELEAPEPEHSKHARSKPAHAAKPCHFCATPGPDCGVKHEPGCPRAPTADIVAAKKTGARFVSARPAADTLIDSQGAVFDGDTPPEGEAWRRDCARKANRNPRRDPNVGVDERFDVIEYFVGNRRDIGTNLTLDEALDRLRMDILANRDHTGNWRIVRVDTWR